MKFGRLILISSLFIHTNALLACGMHPGLTHEQWTSAVKNERDPKTGAVVTLSDSFFGPSNSAPPPAEGSSRRGGSRPVDTRERAGR